MPSTFGRIVRNLFRALTGRAPEDRDAGAMEAESRISAVEVTGADDSVVVLVNAALQQLAQGPEEEFRVDPRRSPAAACRVGAAWNDLSVPPEALQNMVRRLKVMANLDLGNRTVAQQGTFILMGMGSKHRFDVAIEPLGGGDEAARVVHSKTPL